MHALLMFVLLCLLASAYLKCTLVQNGLCALNILFLMTRNKIDELLEREEFYNIDRFLEGVQDAVRDIYLANCHGSLCLPG